MIKKGEQTLALSLGKTGCYFFCLCQIAEEVTKKEVNVLDAARKAIAKGHMETNCYVKYPGLILEMLTGKKWSVTHGPYPYMAKKNEYIIERWEKKNTMSTDAHFVREKFDSLSLSPVVRDGKPVSTRICKMLN